MAKTKTPLFAGQSSRGAMMSCMPCCAPRHTASARSRNSCKLQCPSDPSGGGRGSLAALPVLPATERKLHLFLWTRSKIQLQRLPSEEEDPEASRQGRSQVFQISAEWTMSWISELPLEGQAAAGQAMSTETLRCTLAPHEHPRPRRSVPTDWDRKALLRTSFVDAATGFHRLRRR